MLFGFTQNILLKQSYKAEIAHNLAANGKTIQTELLQYTGSDYTIFVRYQASRYNLGVYILEEDGTILFPASETTTPDLDADSLDFTEKVERLKERLSSVPNKAVIYEDPTGEFVYGAEMSYNKRPVYLYVCKPLQLIENVVAQMNIRTLLLAVFVLLLSFTISSAISGVLTKPITEMTEKAKLLARGDFSVDFHGKSYGSEMELLAETLNFARDEIAKADQMQKELIANVSHDFKTPLTMIKAYASMIQEISGNNPEKRNKHTQVIIDEADRLTSLVNDVLDLSKIRSGIDSLKPQVFDLSEYTLGVLEKFEYLSERDGYRFETEIEKDLYTQADPIKIGEVLYNLIGNAVNYTGENKLVKVSLKRQADGVIR